MINVEMNQSGSEEDSMSRALNGHADHNHIPPSSSLRTLLNRYSPYLRVVCAEMLGTFMVVFSICAVIAVGRITREIGLVEYAGVGALAIIVVVFSTAHISGAHINPSVTLAFAVVGQFPWSQVPGYVIAQFTSGILGAYAAKEVYGIEGELGTTKPSLGWEKAFWVESIASFFIMFLASALSTDARAIGHLGAIPVGASIALGVFITAPLSGGSMNPARSFGPAVISNDYKDIWVYFLAPTLGCLGGAIAYRFVRQEQRHTLPTSSP